MGVIRIALCLACIEKRHLKSARYDSEYSPLGFVRMILISPLLLLLRFGNIVAVIGDLADHWRFVQSEKERIRLEKIAYAVAAANRFTGACLRDMMQDVRADNAITLLNGEAVQLLVEDGLTLEEILNAPESRAPLPPPGKNRLRKYGRMFNAMDPWAAPERILPLYNHLMNSSRPAPKPVANAGEN